MKTVVLAVLFFLSIQIGYSQEKDSLKYAKFKIEGGVVIPIGKLSEKIGISPQLGFWYRTRMEHNDFLDFGFSVYKPSSKGQFGYQGKDSLYQTKAYGLSGTLGFRMNKVYGVTAFRKKVDLEWCSSVGYGFFMFEDKEKRNRENPRFDNENPTMEIAIDTKAKALSSLCLGQGISLNHKNIGLQLHYNFTPYHWFSKKIESDFGSHSLTLNASYRL